MEPRTFSISDVLSQGWAYFKKYWIFALILVGAAIVIDIISSIFAPSGMAEMLQMKFSDPEALSKDPDKFIALFTEMMSKSQVSSIISSLVKFAIYAGLANMVMLIIKGIKDELAFDAFAMAPMTYVKYIVVEIIVGILTAVGTCLCIIPGIIVYLRLQFAATRIIDEPETGIIDAIKYSWDLTSGNFWNLFLFALASIGLYIVGLLCCCIGALVVEAWLFFATMLIYFALKPADTVEEPQTEYLTQE